MLAPSTSIFLPSYTPPAGFRIDGRLECIPTDPAYAEPDYEAVMASAEDLRAWSGSDWPEPGFSLEENREDLAGHAEDNRDKAAFGYMLFRPGKLFCLGSLYVSPINRERWLPAGRPELAARDAGPAAGAPSTAESAPDPAILAWFGGLEARVDLWLRSGVPEAGALLGACLDWLRRDWPEGLALALRPRYGRMLSLLEAMPKGGPGPRRIRLFHRNEDDLLDLYEIGRN